VYVRVCMYDRNTLQLIINQNESSTPYCRKFKSGLSCSTLWCLTGTKKDGEMERAGENVCNKSGLSLEDKTHRRQCKMSSSKKIDL
jgi:hypothetical protein